MSSERLFLDSKQNTYKEYDPQFTADISKKMQLPERLMAVNGYYDDSSPSFPSLRGTHQFNLPLSQAPYDEPHYVLATPPNSITNFAGTTLADEDNSDPETERNLIQRSFRENKSSLSNAGKDAAKDEEDEDEYDESSIPMTPGTMLLLHNGDSFAALQRQIGKLNHRVVKLQEENKRRKNRELVFYPLIIGYLIFQLGRFVFKPRMW